MPEPFGPSRAEGPPVPLCDTWQQQSEGRSPVRFGSWSGSRAAEATGPRLQLGLYFLGWAEGRGRGKNGLTLSGFGFGLTRIRGSRLPYPTSADFPASFLSLSSSSSLFVILLSFLEVLQPKVS